METFLGEAWIIQDPYNFLQSIANGLVDRFRRQLKAAIKSQPNPTTWIDSLPIILLRIRTTIKEDLGCSSAELIYSTTLRIPGAFFNPAPTSATSDVTDYVETLKSTMQRLRVVSPRQSHNRPVHVQSELATSTYILIRQDAVQKPLQPPYNDPYKVIRHTAKHFTVDVKGKQEVVLPEVHTAQSHTVTINLTPTIITTHSGRQVNRPLHLDL